MVQLAGIWLGKHWDLGSIHRSPIFLNIFCLNVILCSTRPKFYHAPYAQAGHASNSINPRASIGGLPYALVNIVTRIPERSTKGLNSLGQIKDHTSKIGVNTPHWFAYYFLSFHFFSIYLFYLFLIKINFYKK